MVLALIILFLVNPSSASTLTVDDDGKGNLPESSRLLASLYKGEKFNNNVTKVRFNLYLEQALYLRT